MKTILLSYPKSGSDWIRYVCEFIYQQPTGPAPARVTVVRPTVEDSCKLGGGAIFTLKHHGFRDTEKLMTTIRNFIDVIPGYIAGKTKNKKYLKTPAINDLLTTKVMNSHCRHYFDNIKKFDQFNKEKYLINYENLILTPKGEFLKIFNFLKEPDPKRVENFFNNYETHKTQSLQYQKKPGHMLCITEGDINKTWKNVVKPEKIDHMVNYFIQEDEDIFNRYLKAYTC